MTTTNVTQIQSMLTTLVGIPSQARQEDQVRDYIARYAQNTFPNAQLTQDDAGNLIVTIPGTAGKEHVAPLMFNAHMDRVPPGKGHIPRIDGDRMFSDGATNLGADDAAGITIILLAVQALYERGLPHGPLTLLFTVQEEVGLKGAQAFDPAPYGVREGIVFDNAGAPGLVVTRGAAYIAFDAALHGRGGHPAKDLAQTVSAIEIFRRLDLPVGILDDGATRISLGVIHGGTARNQIAEEVIVQGELRTLLDATGQAAWQAKIQQAFADAATALGGTADVTFDPHGASYEVDPQEPLLQTYQAAWEQVTGTALRTMDTFVGSDTNVFREHMRTFTVSTGATQEHTKDEYIDLSPLIPIIETAVLVAARYTGNGSG